MATKVSLLYGSSDIEVNLNSDNVTVIKEASVPPLKDEKASFLEATHNPIGTSPLSQIIQNGDKVAVVIPDGTRPLPTAKLLTWLFEQLDQFDISVTIVNGTGSHRANTDEETINMVGEKIFKERTIVHHNAHKPETMAAIGTKDGHTVYMNKAVVNADKRIVLGLIEPHFMAGFSGGFKGIFPGVADIDSIMHYHRASVVGDPSSTWGVLENNATQNIVRAFGSMLPIDFLINVTINTERQMTGIYCGHPIKAHEVGCMKCREQIMKRMDHRVPIVITTNFGYPLDQNLYQSVKGMSAAAKIVTQGGLILQASECRDGFPAHGNFKKLLFDHDSPQAVLDTIETPGFSVFDQWEAQLLAKVQLQARVGLMSSLDDEDVRRAHCFPVHDIAKAVDDELNRIGKDAPIAVLPEGFMRVPFVEEPVVEKT